MDHRFHAVFPRQSSGRKRKILEKSKNSGKGVAHYVNYFDIQVLMMVTKTETLTSTLHHNIFTYFDYVFSAAFILSDFIHIDFHTHTHTHIYIYMGGGKNSVDTAPGRLDFMAYQPL